MQNKDKPASPIRIQPTEQAIQQAQAAGLEIGNTVYMGLSKREDFAKAALQGILSNDTLLNLINKKHPDFDVFTVAAASAVKAADQLLEQLETGDRLDLSIQHKEG